MGVQSTLPNVPSLSLGSAEITLLDMTRAFGSVAAGVQAIEPYSIRSIAGTSQQALFTKPSAGAEVSGQLAASRAMMTDLLQAVVTEGTGKAARLPNAVVAGKTGTTQDYRDALFVGMAGDLVTGVWVGNDDNAPMDGVTGGTLPARIWHDFMDGASLEANEDMALMKGWREPREFADSRPAVRERRRPSFSNWFRSKFRGRGKNKKR